MAAEVSLSKALKEASKTCVNCRRVSVCAGLKPNTELDSKGCSVGFILI